MSDKLERWRDYARIALAGIRLFNGAAALFAPKLLARQLGADANSGRTAIYVLRLFGVRTIVVGIELLVPDEKLRASALRYAIPIHASDTVSAALAGMRGQLPSRASIMLTAISGVNTVLAILYSGVLKRSPYDGLREKGEEDEINKACSMDNPGTGGTRSRHHSFGTTPTGYRRTGSHRTGSHR